MRVKDPSNIAEAIVNPKDAEFIAWAENAPKRCLIIADDSVRFEGFASAFEFLTWLRHIVPEKKELVDSITRLALEKWESEYAGRVPPERRKP